MEENISHKAFSSRTPPINPLNSNVPPPPVCPPVPLKFFSKRRNENVAFVTKITSQSFLLPRIVSKYLIWSTDDSGFPPWPTGFPAALHRLLFGQIPSQPRPFRSAKKRARHERHFKCRVIGRLSVCGSATVVSLRLCSRRLYASGSLSRSPNRRPKPWVEMNPRFQVNLFVWFLIQTAMKTCSFGKRILGALAYLSAAER